MQKFTCLEDGIIRFKEEGGMIIEDWHFGVKNAPNIGSILNPYIFIGSKHPEALLSIVRGLPK